MDIIRKIWPLSFNASDTSKLVINLIIYLVLPTAIGIVLGILSVLPFIGVLLGAVGSLFSLYCTVGLVLIILVYVKVIN